MTSLESALPALPSRPKRFRLPSGLPIALARWGATLAIVAIAALVAAGIWDHYETDPWTRDSHVRADVVRVTSDVGGLVTQVSVRDSETVKRGQLLFVLDRPRLAAALDQADANIAAANATLDEASKRERRDEAVQDLVAAEAQEQDAAKVSMAQATLRQAVAARRVAALNLTRTEVRATADGVVTNLDLHPGDYLAPGAQALALVDRGSLRVEAYFEETKLDRIHVGEQAKIMLMGDRAPLFGHVESIAGGIADDQAVNTGNLLPQVQPTFSWVRLAERIPVRIHVDQAPVGTRLIPGRTATVRILPPPNVAKTRPASTPSSGPKP
jgi:multidrug resistance efflux pump